MSLRDWFAGMALCLGEGVYGGSAYGTAKNCYEIADAMLRERERGGRDG